MKRVAFPACSLMALPPLVTHIAVLILGYLGHELTVPSRTVSWTYDLSSSKNAILFPLTHEPSFPNAQSVVYIASLSPIDKEYCLVFNDAFKFRSLPKGGGFLQIPLILGSKIPFLLQGLSHKKNGPFILIGKKPARDCPHAQQQVVYGS